MTVKGSRQLPVISFLLHRRSITTKVHIIAALLTSASVFPQKDNIMFMLARQNCILINFNYPAQCNDPISFPQNRKVNQMSHCYGTSMGNLFP